MDPTIPESEPSAGARREAELQAPGAGADRFAGAAAEDQAAPLPAEQPSGPASAAQDGTAPRPPGEGAEAICRSIADPSAEARRVPDPVIAPPVPAEPLTDAPPDPAALPGCRPVPPGAADGGPVATAMDDAAPALVAPEPAPCPQPDVPQEQAGEPAPGAASVVALAPAAPLPSEPVPSDRPAADGGSARVAPEPAGAVLSDAAPAVDGGRGGGSAEEGSGAAATGAVATGSVAPVDASGGAEAGGGGAGEGAGVPLSPDDDFPGEVEMPLVDHLEELRRRVLRSLLAVVVAAAGCLLFVRPLVRLLEVPAQGIRFLQLAPGEFLFVSLKVAGYAGLTLAIPWILFEALAFVLPGLTRRERRLVAPTVAGSTLLFAAGLAFAWWALVPAALRFLVSYGADVVEPIWSIERYLDFVLLLMVVTALAFQLPVLQLLLGALGLVDARRMLGAWRWVVLASALAGAVLTPSTDPVTMLLLSGAITGLYLIGVALVALVSRPRPRFGQV